MMSIKICLVTTLLICGSSAFNILPWGPKIFRTSQPRPSSPSKPGQSGSPCGERLKVSPGDFGVIQSPGYPNSYKANLDCEWIIEGSPNSTIQGTFFDIHTRNALISDISDSVFFSTSGNWEHSQRLSGDMNSLAPLVLFSEGNSFLLRFKSSPFSESLTRGFRFAFYVEQTGKPSYTAPAVAVSTVILCTVTPVNTPQVVPGEGASLRDKLAKITRVNPNPFLVALVLDDQQFCSGTLVGDHHVVTSAHCTRGVKSIAMIFGTDDLTISDAGVQKTSVNSSSVTEHPHFDQYTGANDISVIRLNKPLTLTKFVSPAYLPYWSNLWVTLGGEKVDMSGWGDSDNGAIYSQSSKQEITIFPNYGCKGINRGTTGQTMCSRNFSPQSKSVCQADSGSPVTVRASDANCGGSTANGGSTTTGANANRPAKPGRPQGKPGRPHYIERFNEELRANTTNVPQPKYVLLGLVSHGSCEKGFTFTRATAYLDFLTQALSK